MSSREVTIHGIYRHFKGKYYIVEGIAKHSETKEPMVVYRHLYGDKALCVRPLDMFLSEVGHEKYRFEEVEDISDCGLLFDALCKFYGVEKEAADAQDALMSAVWASASRFSEGIK